MFHMCILGLWKTLEARAVPSWNPSPGMIHRVALNATPCSSCVLSKKLETECLIRSCPQQFWRFWPWMQMAITVMLPHAQGFCIINLRPAPQFVQEKTSCICHLVVATARTVSLSSRAAWVTLAEGKLRNFCIWLVTGRGDFVCLAFLSSSFFCL